MNTTAKITAKRAIFDRQDCERPLGLYEPQRKEREISLTCLAIASVIGASLWAAVFYVFCHQQVLKPLADIVEKLR